jgi:hypothetical protein
MALYRQVRVKAREPPAYGIVLVISLLVADSMTTHPRSAADVSFR